MDRDDHATLQPEDAAQRAEDREREERHRDAGDGQFVSAEEAAKRPGETVAETRRHPTTREVDAARILLTATLARDLRDGDRRHRTNAEATAAMVDRIHDLRAGITAALTLLKQ